MVFNGVEILKLQFSRAIDMTFERFLDSWSMQNHEEEAGVVGHPIPGGMETDVPINFSA